MRVWANVEAKPLAVAELGVAYRRYRLADPSAEEAMARSLRGYGQLAPVIEARRQRANQAVRGDDDDDHYHTVANPAKGEKPGERGAGPPKPTGYRPGRTTQQRRPGKKSDGPKA